MKKKIILSIFCCLTVLLVATGCGNIIDETTTKVENAFSSLYEIERLEVISENGSSHQNTIRKMKANDMDFYFITYSQGNGLDSNNRYIYTSILSSVYEKYQNQIKNLALKYQIDISFNFTTDKYKEEDYFDDCPACKGHFITVNINSYQRENLSKFINEVLAIDEINNLYQKWLNDGVYEYLGSEFFVYDYSDIFFDGDKNSTSSIFEYYYENIDGNN